jgi:hypothetical protein
MLLRKLTCPAGVLQIDRGLYKNIKSEKFMKFEIYTPIYIINRGVIEVSTEHIYVFPVYIFSWYKYTNNL